MNSPKSTPKSEPVRVIAFPGAPNLPTFAALEHGIFRRHGIEVSLELTPSSVAQAEGVAAGEYDIAFTAFDNVLAYARGGHVDPGYMVVMGATQLEVSLVASASIETHGDLAGRPVALDALGTGFAFIMYDMLERAGVDLDRCVFEAVGATPLRWNSVRSGTHAASMMIEPFTTLARNAGFRILDSSRNLYSSYQGGVVAARRAVLGARPLAVRKFIAAYLDGLAWVLQPENRPAVAELLSARMDIPTLSLDAVLDNVLSPSSGLTPNGAVLPEGMATVTELRSRYGSGAVLPDTGEVLDLSLWDSVVRSRSAG